MGGGKGRGGGELGSGGSASPVWHLAALQRPVPVHASRTKLDAWDTSSREPAHAGERPVKDTGTAVRSRRAPRWGVRARGTLVRVWRERRAARLLQRADGSVAQPHVSACATQPSRSADLPERDTEIRAREASCASVPAALENSSGKTRMSLSGRTDRPARCPFRGIMRGMSRDTPREHAKSHEHVLSATV